MPDGALLIGYAVDVAAIIVARNVEDAKIKVNHVIIRTKSRLEGKGLKQATEKTELISLANMRHPCDDFCNVILSSEEN